MGISLVVATKSAVLLVIAAAILTYRRRSSSSDPPTLFSSWPYILPILHASIVDLLVAIASHPSVNRPSLLGKRSDGSIPLRSRFLFGPFLVFCRLYVFLKNSSRRRKESAYSEVSPGLYVGRWPSLLSAGGGRRSGGLLSVGADHATLAVVDCTCELPRSSLVLRNPYFCVPAWDTRAPSLIGLDAAVRWIVSQSSRNYPVYVHCAFGHGRSVCVMCAALVALGLAEDWKIAEKMVRDKRPRIRMNSSHRKILEEWTRHCLPSKTKENKATD